MPQHIIATIVGARPQFIKAAVISRILRGTPNFSEILIHTGQHYDANMSDIFFQELGIPRPEVSLNIGSGTHGAQTGKMLEAIEKVLLDTKPTGVLVYGDTNSTLAGALAAAKLHIPISHVEAGLRSFNRRMPEEINRVVTDHLSEFLFCPTEEALNNLRAENIPADKTFLVGDVMYDGALYYAAAAETRSAILKTLNLARGKYILATIHRAESTDDPKKLAIIFEALARAASEWQLVLPLHPRTTGLLKKFSIRHDHPNFTVISPVGYLDMTMLQKNSALIITDSGGIQKEAFFHRVPCVTLRSETEWVESVALGWNRLCPISDSESMATTILGSIGTQGKEGLPYGKGNAGELIVEVLKRPTQP